MAQTFYAQNERPESTMTVGQLIDQLRAFGPDMPVIFKSPMYGCFGSNTAYSLESVEQVSMDRREVTYTGQVSYDEETDTETPIDDYTDVFHAWSGVVIG